CKIDFPPVCRAKSPEIQSIFVYCTKTPHPRRCPKKMKIIGFAGVRLNLDFIFSCLFYTLG
ncbi:hypothetical protein L6232_26070, partial [Shewanella sp. C31]|nr:hypothetical protein [Shewanella electrica]